MTRRTSRLHAVTPVVAPHQALLATDLEDWAGEEAARSGRKYALMSRVERLRLSAEGTVIEARVRGSATHPYRVEVVAGDGGLVSSCNCDNESHRACKHAVAAVEALRFPRTAIRAPRGRGRRSVAHRNNESSGFTLVRDERVSVAREQELDERRKRARREKSVVRLLSAVAGPPRFSVARQGKARPWRVVLRGAKLEEGSCNCPDFAKSELATCKHVERVRSWCRRQRGKRRRTKHSDWVSVWWKPREWPAQQPAPLREIRIDLPAGSANDGAGRWFGSDGWLTPPVAGIDPGVWASAGVDAARAVASAAGWAFDLDPNVQTHIDESLALSRTHGQLAGLGEGTEAWNEIVPTLGIRLHRYQEVGVHFLATTGRAMLADDMGLGKTVQAIAAALLLRRGGGARRVLVVCPASIKHQWRHEIAKACAETARIADEGKAGRIRQYRVWKSGFLILNYELVVRDLDLILATRPDLIILDEAQRIKNWDTKTAVAVKQLESPYAFVLTGTPLENRLGELHSLVEFLHPRALGPRWRLMPFHSRTDVSGRITSYEDLDVLRARLQPFFLRRERSEVADQLPERTDHTFWTGMTAVQRRPYRAQAARLARLLAHRRTLRPGEVRVVLQTLTSMRILCNAWAQFEFDQFASKVAGDAAATPEDLRMLHSPKLEEFARVLEDLLEERRTKVVVFSQWERMLRLAHYVVRGLLTRRGERAEVFHGGLDGKARIRMLEAFRADESLRVMFSTDAGGLGLNLQEAAAVVVNLEVPWNPATLDQRAARVHRLGQRRQVQVIHFVTFDAIEERVRQVVESKRALFAGLLVDDADRVVLGDAEGGTFVEHLRGLID